jgi:hypothetical protein
MVRNITILGGDYTVACLLLKQMKRDAESSQVRTWSSPCELPSRMSTPSTFYHYYQLHIPPYNLMPHQRTTASQELKHKRQEQDNSRQKKAEQENISQLASKRALGAFFPFFITNILPNPSQSRPTIPLKK